jgi:hypothetical protein
MASSTQEEETFFFFEVLGFELTASTHARQALDHLSHISSTFCFNYFLDRVSHFCLGLDGTTILPVPPTTTQLTGWDGISLNFFAWAGQTTILPISTFQVAGIRGMHLHAWPLDKGNLNTNFIFFYSFIHMCIHCLDRFFPPPPRPILISKIKQGTGCHWLMPITLATLETEMENHSSRPAHLQNNQSKMDWRHDSSGRVPSLQVWNLVPPKGNFKR